MDFAQFYIKYLDLVVLEHHQYTYWWCLSTTIKNSDLTISLMVLVLNPFDIFYYSHA